GQPLLEIDDLSLACRDCLHKFRVTRAHRLALRDKIFVTLSLGGNGKTQFVQLLYCLGSALRDSFLHSPHYILLALGRSQRPLLPAPLWRRCILYAERPVAYGSQNTPCPARTFALCVRVENPPMFPCSRQTQLPRSKSIRHPPWQQRFRCAFSSQPGRHRDSERLQHREAIVQQAMRSAPALSLCQSPNRAIFQEPVLLALLLCHYRVVE